MKLQNKYLIKNFRNSNKKKIDDMYYMLIELSMINEEKTKKFTLSLESMINALIDSILDDMRDIIKNNKRANY